MEKWAPVGRCAMAGRRRYVTLRTQLFSGRSCDDITGASTARAGTCYQIRHLWELAFAAAPLRRDKKHCLSSPSDPPATPFASLCVPRRCPSLSVARPSLTLLGAPTPTSSDTPVPTLNISTAPFHLILAWPLSYSYLFPSFFFSVFDLQFFTS